MSRQIKNRVGEINTTNSGLTMRIISYENSKNITVEFIDCGIIKENIDYSSFKKGKVKAPMVFETEGNITKCTNPELKFSFLIDTEDLPKVRGNWWNKNNGGYVHSNRGLLHRIIINPLEGEEVDHINGIRTDNRKENLRVCTRAENACNIHKNKRYAGGYKGVFWYKPYKKWMANISHNNKHIFLGYFKDNYEAAKAYNEAAIKLHGEFACLNPI